MPQVFLATQMLHAANQPRLDPLSGRTLHAFRWRPGVLLDALPEPFAARPARIDEGRADIFARERKFDMGDGKPNREQLKEAQAKGLAGGDRYDGVAGKRSH